MNENPSRYLMIAELAEKYGLTTRALRFYEGLGLLKPERRGRVRYFSPEQEAVLRLILRANRLGLSFPEIARRLDKVRLSVEIKLDDLGQAEDRYQREAMELVVRQYEVACEKASLSLAGLTSRNIYSDAP